MTKGKMNNSGITLIALVITVIILLILAGISIGMLSGDNSIIGQAGNAKTQTDIAQEKEILQTATLAAMGKSKYGDITKEKLDNELNNYTEIKNTEQTDNGIVVTFKSNRAYLVNSDGDVSSYSDIKIENLVVKDGNTVLAENCKSVQLGKTLTISFDASIENGQITSITPNIAYTTAGERSKTFTIIGKTTDGQEITKEYTVNLKGYYNIPDLKVGDFVNYTLKTPTTSELNKLNSDIETYSGATDNTEKIATGSTLLCRVLEMDSNGNPTKLISADGVNTLKLQGANGYNNAVYLINEMCETLYSGNQGTTKSLTIEDLEKKYFSDAAIAIRDEYRQNTSSVQYGEKKRYTGSYSTYPLLAAKEKRMGINTETEVVNGVTLNKINILATALDLSEQTEEDLETGGKTLTSAANGITVTQTNYNISGNDVNYKSVALKNIIHNKYIESSENTSEVTRYWMASRCVDVISSNTLAFSVRRVWSTRVQSDALYYPGVTSIHSATNAVRPIINLNSEIQVEYIEKYNSTYNIWNLN